MLRKKNIQKILFLLAKLVLKKYKPEIIGITGSVGKTSTKEAVYLVLKDKFRTRRNIKNYNNEFGVPLTILGLETVGKSFTKWTKNLLRAFLIIFFPVNYPRVLILELGADKPGDIDYLLKLIKPYLKIGIITAVKESHLEFFKKEEKIFEEKAKLIKALSQGDWAIINIDCERAKRMVNEAKAKVLSFGFKEGAQFRASDLIYFSSGISFKIHFQGSVVPIRLSEIFAEHQVYQILAAGGVGTCYGLTLIEIVESLSKFSPLAGRMRLIPGIKQSLILDDSYNASPTSAIAALKTLLKIKQVKEIKGKIISVLGDMLELGDFTEEGHRKVGEVAAENSDLIIGVGERILFLIDQAKKQGFSEDRIYHFYQSEEAGKFIQDKLLEKNDLLLIKGSRAMKMEKIVKELMEEPLKFKDYI